MINENCPLTVFWLLVLECLEMLKLCTAPLSLCLSHVSVFVMEALCVQESCRCLFQTTGNATVHWCRELPGEAGQLHHALRNLHLCWQRGQLCVRLEHGHRLVVRSQRRAHTLLCINTTLLCRHWSYQFCFCSEELRDGFCSEISH